MEVTLAQNEESNISDGLSIMNESNSQDNSNNEEWSSDVLNEEEEKKIEKLK